MKHATILRIVAQIRSVVIACSDRRKTKRVDLGHL